MELVSCVICSFKPRIHYSSWDDVLEIDYVVLTYSMEQSPS
jgi:hypothetical protein